MNRDTLKGAAGVGLLGALALVTGDRDRLVSTRGRLEDRAAVLELELELHLIESAERLAALEIRTCVAGAETLRDARQC